MTKKLYFILILGIIMCKSHDAFSLPQSPLDEEKLTRSAKRKTDKTEASSESTPSLGASLKDAFPRSLESQPDEEELTKLAKRKTDETEASSESTPSFGASVKGDLKLFFEQRDERFPNFLQGMLDQNGAEFSGEGMNLKEIKRKICESLIMLTNTQTSLKDEINTMWSMVNSGNAEQKAAGFSELVQITQNFSAFEESGAENAHIIFLYGALDQKIAVFSDENTNLCSKLKDKLKTERPEIKEQISKYLRMIMNDPRVLIKDRAKATRLIFDFKNLGEIDENFFACMNAAEEPSYAEDIRINAVNILWEHSQDEDDNDVNFDDDDNDNDDDFEVDDDPDYDVQFEIHQYAEGMQDKVLVWLEDKLVSQDLCSYETSIQQAYEWIKEKAFPEDQERAALNAIEEGFKIEEDEGDRETAQVALEKAKEFFSKAYTFIHVFHPDKMEMYMAGFVGESIEAYVTREKDPESCRKGVIERSMTGLRGIEESLDLLFQPAEAVAQAKSFMSQCNFKELSYHGLLEKKLWLLKKLLAVGVTSDTTAEEAAQKFEIYGLSYMRSLGLSPDDQQKENEAWFLGLIAEQKNFIEETYETDFKPLISFEKFLSQVKGIDEKNKTFLFDAFVQMDVHPYLSLEEMVIFFKENQKEKVCHLNLEEAIQSSFLEEIDIFADAIKEHFTSLGSSQEAVKVA